MLFLQFLFWLWDWKSSIVERDSIDEEYGTNNV